jgi:hypothetical protein
VGVTKSASQNIEGLFRNAPGPAPWYVRPGSPNVHGFEWQQTSAMIPKTGKTLLVGSAGVVAVIGFYVSLKVIDDATLLAWYQPKTLDEDVTSPIRMFVFQPSKMKPFDTDLVEVEERMSNTGARLALSDEPEASIELTTTHLNEELEATFPEKIRQLDELLILCSSSAVHSRPDMKVDLALLVAKPRLNTYRLYPQDWFNASDLDFGYQWVTRVVRNPSTGNVHGEGFRIAPFQLDDSHCSLVSNKPSSSDRGDE